MLPYLDQAPLYQQYRFDEPWDGPHNSQLARRIPAVYRCPSYEKYHARHGLESPHRDLLTNYVAICSADAIFDGERATAIKDIPDGTSHTLLVAEARQHAVHWMQPDDASENEILVDLQSTKGEHHANHLGGIHVLLADGSVRFVSSATRPELFHGLVTRAGKEPADDF